jgi:anti-sigma B factor antagonist
MEQLDQNKPPLAIELSTDEHGDPLIRLRGELDIASADTLRETVSSVLATAPNRLVFELDELLFIDSSGIAVLVLASNNVDKVELHHAQPIVTRVVELTGLSGTLRIVES